MGFSLLAFAGAVVAAVALAVNGDAVWAGLMALLAAFAAWLAVRDYRERRGELRRERNGPRSGESAGELGEDR
jgi:hypothetical protein